jgi:hypothetical protein
MERIIIEDEYTEMTIFTDLNPESLLYIMEGKVPHEETLSVKGASYAPRFYEGFLSMASGTKYLWEVLL